MFDFFEDFGWLDIGILGGLSEEMAEEERERRKIEDDWNKDQENEDNF
ncbi:MAG: hypothetical protein PF503_19960 [Desulfobacula sp.]|jgi:hypothetical protein|nr:hypothetical protein [Desulfobacula sp.]